MRSVDFVLEEPIFKSMYCSYCITLSYNSLQLNTENNLNIIEITLIIIFLIEV